ncbi:GNAT family N-acetyltransferase [Actinoplanes derwentensis]|uniref:Acetyltransferase (GNAT) domain-containing protein n=1 Tax=Actinoplanes derwentensis TaxID=113562 RepID=A0A1H2CW42_9ACTN|nr:GNAT family N-acetyltransferase [Actinoplanes derwentensis]GID82054.1 hypothetical protein Ade03nite_09780 [Actinoplanes derwentensis]SDT74487.1 Acetyltransferase (GNAT) domain-containing protein [Actinoplanes derwentensis]
MTTTATIQTAGPAHLHQVAEILAAASHAGDLADWLVPHHATRARIFPRYFEILAEHALTHGHVHVVDDVGVAVWYALDAYQYVDIADLDRRLAQAVGDHLPHFVALDLAVQAYQPDSRAHHYLAALAVRPGQQGHGTGSLLLHHHLKELDDTRVPSCLVATGARSVTLFRRHGYTKRPPYPLASVAAPLLFPMWRDARSAHDPPSKGPT